MTTPSQPADRRPAVSVVIPTYNRVDRLATVLAALAVQTVADREIIVVSDGSTDGTDELLTRLSATGALVAVHQANAGPAAARNAGVERARADLVVFIDDDVVPEPTLLERHIDAHRERNDLVVIGPMLTPPDAALSPWIRWEQHMLYRQYDDMLAGRWQPTFRQFYTGNASVRRQHVIDAGGFDVRYRRAEDIELASRLAERGLAFRFDPTARGFHHAERSYAGWRAVARAYGRNDAEFMHERMPWLRQALADELRSRHVLQRTVVRATLGRPRLAAAIATLVEHPARLLDRLGLAAPARQLLSAAYVVEYVDGLCEGLGSTAAVSALLLAPSVARRAPDDGQLQPATLLTVSGTIPEQIEQSVADGERPEADYLALRTALPADLLDRAAVDRSGIVARLIDRFGGKDAAMAWCCFASRRRYATIVTDGEQVGLPLALLLACVPRSRTPSHAMIVHRMSTRSKSTLFRWLRLGRRIDLYVVYASAQRDHLVGRLGVAPQQVVLTTFAVDTEFFDPARVPPSATPEGICSAGLELRDYDTLVEATGDLDVTVTIAAASPWSRRANLLDGEALPANVTTTALSLAELRQLYADSALVAIPLQPTDFQAGITTILEAMSMAKPIVCTRTDGQTDTIVDGVTGCYVAPEDPADLRAAIGDLLGSPERQATLGRAARTWVVAHADVRVYAARLAEHVRQLHPNGQR